MQAMQYQREGLVHLPANMRVNSLSAGIENPRGRTASPATVLLACPLALLALLGSYFDVSCASAQIAAYPALARWVARLASLATYALVTALLCSGRSLTRRPDGKRSRALVAACALLGAGMAGTLYASDTLPAFVASQVLVGAGQAFTLVAWAEATCAASRPLRWRFVIAAGLVSTAVSLAFRLLAPPAARVLLLAITLGCCTLPALTDNRENDAGPKGSKTGTPALAQGLAACLRTVSWELALLMAGYALLFRVMGSLDYATPLVTPLLKFGVTTVGLLVMGAYLSSREGSPDGPNAIVLPLVVLAATALVAVPTPGSELRVVSSAVAGSCWPLFYLALWVMLLAMPAPRGTNGASVFSAGWLVLNVFLVALAPIAHTLAQQVNQGALSLAALAFVLAYTIGVATLLARRHASQDRAAARYDRQGNLESILARMSVEAGLTPREQDVLALLARGRSAPFIAEALSISPSTVKGHVRHLYAKLGVSSKQELLSALERAKR